MKYSQVSIIGIFALVAMFTPVYSANWVVAAAGGVGYVNYGQQSDICHLYHIMIRGGIPASNIITFSMNDAVHATQNPFPGKLFNKPNGPEVYSGCVIDYQGTSMTSANYYAVLKGEKDKVSGGTGRVLGATSADNVFLSFDDHGGNQVLGFGHDKLYAKDVLTTLAFMHQNNRYNKLVFFIEACHSGSMFVNLPSDQNIYGLTSANPDENAYETYCPSEDLVKGLHIGACMGDNFSVHWMEFSDANPANTQTFEQQFAMLVEKVTTSHPTQYGDLSWQKTSTSDFIGRTSFKKKSETKTSEQQSNTQGVTFSKENTKLMFLINQHSRNPNSETFMELNKEITHRKRLDDSFLKIMSELNLELNNTDTDFDCYKELYSFYDETCGDMGEYGMIRYSTVLFNMCATPYYNTEVYKSLISDSCSQQSEF